MSAYILNDASINYLVDAAMSLAAGRKPLRISYNGSAYVCVPDENSGETDQEGADRLGQALFAQNTRSVNAVYAEGHGDQAEPGFTWRPLGQGVSLLTGAKVAAEYPQISLHPTHRSIAQVFKLLDCYEYQSCEDAGWPTSDAYSICQALRKAYCARVTGYTEAAWGISAPTHTVETLVFHENGNRTDGGVSS